MDTSILLKIKELTDEYMALNLSEVLDYEKYKLYSIVASSTQLEGSTLDALDTKLLLEDGLTSKCKPLEHHLMVQDNYNAIKYALAEADKQTLISAEFLKRCNSLNMAQTGFIRHTMSGAVVDGTKGEFRQDGAFAEMIGTYPNAQKIPQMVTNYCEEYNRQLLDNKTLIENLITSFDAHVHLVLIHPWMDGNKRTSRLIMNFIQQRSNIPLTKIDIEDRREYILEIKKVKDTDELESFREFMLQQHIKTMEKEIEIYKKDFEKEITIGRKR